MKICDLHTHSIYSDGSFTPSELIDKGIKAGLSAIALCDHNTVDGIPEFLKAAEGKDIIAVPGIEFSTGYKGIELHILGLFVKSKHFESISEIVKIHDERKERSNIELVDALCRAGYVVDYPAIKAKTPKGHVNRAQIAEELTAKGYTSSTKEAFNTLLSEDYGYYNPPERLNALDIVAFIKSIGGVAVLAHPFIKLSEAKLREFLTEAIPLGLCGMETNYSTFTDEETELAISITREFGILPSGGSDFHGTVKPDISLAIGKGNLTIPFTYYLNLAKLVES